MSAPVVLHDTVRHCGRILRARVLCDVWMYTQPNIRIMRGDLVGRDRGDGYPPQWHEVREVLASNGSYQKYRVAKVGPNL